MTKAFQLGAFVALMASCAGQPKALQEAVPAAPKLSTFSDHVYSVMRQDSISLGEAAARVHALGIEGIDLRTNMTAEQVAVFDSVGFQHSAAIVDLSGTKESVPEMEEKALQFCTEHHFDKLMYCPKLLPENPAPEYMDSMYNGLKAFVDKAQAAGIRVMFEDYDNPRSITCNMVALDKIFERVPNASHAYDSGNFCYIGDDPMEAFHHFRDRIIHMHLKDRKTVGDKESLPLGTGIVPCRQLVDEMMQSGYDGWFVLEGFGAKNMMELLRISVENMTK